MSVLTFFLLAVLVETPDRGTAHVPLFYLMHVSDWFFYINISEKNGKFFHFKFFFLKYVLPLLWCGISFTNLLIFTETGPK